MTDCHGCGREGAQKEAWLATPLGWTVVRAHEGCERAAMDALAGLSGGRVRVIPRPKTREERDAERAAGDVPGVRGAGGAAVPH